MERQDMVALRECACFWQRAAARTLSRKYDEAYKPLGLKGTQFSLLAMVYGIEPDSITELAEAAYMERTSLIRTLDRMVKQGWITLGEEGFRRERTIRITESGKEILEKAIPLWDDLQKQFVDRMGENNWKDFQNHLIAIAEIQ